MEVDSVVADSGHQDIDQEYDPVEYRVYQSEQSIQAIDWVVQILRKLP